MTLNADVSTADVAAKAGTNELADATNSILTVATARTTAATNTLWGLVDTNGLGDGLRSYTDAATNDVLTTATTRTTAATNTSYTASTTYATVATNSLFTAVLSRIAAATNSIAAPTLTGTIALARISGSPPTSGCGVTDAVYRLSGGDVTTAQLEDATNSLLTVSTSRTTAATNTLWSRYG